jgi:hypothetical protein
LSDKYGSNISEYLLTKLKICHIAYALLLIEIVVIL